MRIPPLICLAMALGLASVVHAAPLKFAAVEMPKPDPCLPFIPQTAQWLNEKLPQGASFKYYTRSALERAVKTGEVDVVLSEAGTAAAMQKHGARPMLTAVSRRHPNPVRAQGAVFFVQRDSTVQTLAELAGKKLAATTPDDFTGYWAAMGEVKKQGFEPDLFFGSVDFVGTASKSGMKHVVTLVESGEADVGVVRTCFLEDLARLEARLSNVRVINAYPADGFACRRSTEVYPNWTIFSTSAAEPEVLREVVRVLLDMPKTADGMYWSIAPDFTTLTDLMRELKIGPYEILRHWTLKGFIDQYFTLIVAVLLLLAALAIHAWRASVLVKKRTEELNRSFAEREKLGEQYRRMENQFEQFQKAAIVSQLSNIFVHEIKQPLNSVTCYAHGLLRAIDNEHADTQVFKKGLEKLEHSAHDIGAIVDRVRQYAKGKEPERKMISFNYVINTVAKRFVKSRAVTLEALQDDVMICADELELQVIFTNIIKNAVQAAQMSKDPQVRVKCWNLCSLGEDAVLCTVEDNGPGLSEEERRRLGHTMGSMKDDGLGMGLVVVASLVKRCKGSICFEAGQLGGLLVRVKLPLASDTPAEGKPQELSTQSSSPDDNP